MDKMVRDWSRVRGLMLVLVVMGTIIAVILGAVLLFSFILAQARDCDRLTPDDLAFGLCHALPVVPRSWWNAVADAGGVAVMLAFVWWIWPRKIAPGGDEP